MKNLLSLTELSKTQLSHILEISTQMRRIVQATYKKGPQLAGCNVASVWQKPSTVSNAVTLATHYLSGNPLPFFDVMDVGEFSKSLNNMGVNTLVISNPNDSLLHSLSLNVGCSLLNGGSTQSNPLAVLADLLTLSAKLDGLSNLSVLAVGNRDSNKVAELSHCLNLFGSSLVWFLPKDDYATTRKGIVLDKIDVAFNGADAVIDLGLTEYSEGSKYYGTNGGIDEKYLDKARIDVPLLGNRFIVDSVGIREYPFNAVNTQQSSLVAVAMAMLYLLHSV